MSTTDPILPPSTAAVPPTLGQRFAASPAVWTFGLLNVAAYLYLETHGGPRAIIDNGALVVPLLPGEPWRLLTSTFLHFGAFHLLSNLVGLALFGPTFERLVGTPRFVALWLAAGLAGSAATVLSSSGGLTVAAGASGSVFGLLGAFLFVGWRTRHTPDGAIRLRQAGVLLLINLGFGLMNPSIGLAAHAGGTVAGVLILWRYAARPTAEGLPAAPPSPQRGLVEAVAIGVLAVVLALALGPSW